VFNALARIAREEGIATWWRGCVATMGRAAVVNMAQLASYSQAKEMYLKSGKFYKSTENVQLWLYILYYYNKMYIIYIIFYILN